MDYRAYCCATSAKNLVQKPSWDFLLKQGLIRNVKWNYQKGISISGLRSLPRFSRKSQLGFCTRFSSSAAIGSIVHHLFNKARRRKWSGILQIHPSLKPRKIVTAKWGGRVTVPAGNFFSELVQLYFPKEMIKTRIKEAPWNLCLRRVLALFALA